MIFTKNYEKMLFMLFSKIKMMKGDSETLEDSLFWIIKAASSKISNPDCVGVKTSFDQIGRNVAIKKISKSRTWTIILTVLFLF